MVDLTDIEHMAKTEFPDIVLDVCRIDAKVRMFLVDESFIDFWWSEVQEGRFAHHWNRQHIDGTIHRHDNSPHKKWRHIATFPKHYHCKQEDVVVESFLPEGPLESVRVLLTFCRELIQSSKVSL